MSNIFSSTVYEIFEKEHIKILSHNYTVGVILAFARNVFNYLTKLIYTDWFYNIHLKEKFSQIWKAPHNLLKLSLFDFLLSDEQE